VREISGTLMQTADSILWLFDRVWQWGLSVAAIVSDVWLNGQPWMLISFLTFTALLGYGALSVGQRGFLFIRRIVGGLACLLVVLMMVLPTLGLTFLAVVGGIWIAKSF
jgi:hypothetical protein